MFVMIGSGEEFESPGGGSQIERGELLLLEALLSMGADRALNKNCQEGKKKLLTKRQQSIII